ncbi:GIY-YIG nuclease family protein [Agromyces archimandritae]|uniref:GIY-YIG nuclease family protein n=1 Tax=Agromyces archimandritae TaxID=2781962 RepID=A0A975FNL0_9MICO|nr:GIY-YIG nuclease family protein [Agromyces archimandritae]
MTEATWLYLYENCEQKRLYVGIAKNMSRVWEGHNSDAEDLRDADGTRILQSVEPFSSREDALKAEAIAIHVAALSGMTVHHDEDSNGELRSAPDGTVQLTNRAGTDSTAVLGPAVKRQDGKVEFTSLTNTVIVTIRADKMDERPGPYGGNGGAVFSQRAQKYWPIAARKQPRVKRLLAILSGSHGVILGDWDVDTGADYGPANEVIPLKNPNQDDPRGIKGMRLVGVRGQSGRIYSQDLRGSVPSRTL